MYIYRKYDWLDRTKSQGIYFDKNIGNYKLEKIEEKYFVSSLDPNSNTFKINQTKEEILRDFEDIDGKPLNLRL